jgi:hypothetical protein
VKLPRTRREIAIVETIICAGCALIGALFLLGGHTLQRMSIFLFGWAAGGALHLSTVGLQEWRARRGRRG